VHKEKYVLKKKAKERKRKRIRKKIRGTSERPRVNVFKSNRYVYAQVFNDENGRVLTSASTLEKEFREKNKNTKNAGACQRLGEVLAKKLKQKNIEKVIFDRGVYPYHGRLKALAEAMRKEGIVF
jgi:large subunit ribosomal protein L18